MPLPSSSPVPPAGAIPPPLLALPRATRSHPLLTELLLVAGGSLAIAAGARLEIMLPGMVVPITLQTLAVLLVGALLGFRRGLLATVLYLTEGTAGLPVFAGGAAGPMHLLGPTGGYLLGFVPAAATVGFLVERGWDRHVASTVLAFTIGTAIIFAGGLTWLAAFPVPSLLAAGLWPFLPGAVVKIAVATALVTPARRILGARREAPSDAPSTRQ